MTNSYTTQAIKKDVNDMSEAAHQAAHKAGAKAEDMANKASQSIRDMAEQAGSTVRKFIDERSGQANDLYKSAEDKINANPMKAFAVAALGGLVLGALLKRR